ncbi:LysR substrate-binding domain-containing protein [Sinanaerobacter sp. ZZT-01]|uniref:LysR substrate-binding domain-containing protein n=1 Tax=Sinanaerobacter sp. ZZT-01 TaxID=3111540 RepID=UPI002D787917|nr:LysR substrate-binding domain-containing protein [Sinanaerobacter sp. ZZT-01]WRR93781.1 LysR substrate-binding domain-containing protein [Sinanaerobacter sp. ZZT-01]
MRHLSKLSRRRFSERIGEINGLREGPIRIGTFNSVSAQWLPGMIKRFQHDYPGTRFELPNLPYIALNEGVEDEITAILDKNSAG